MEPFIKEIVPHRAEMSHLEVIGNNPLLRKENPLPAKKATEKFIIDDTWINPEILNADNNVYKNQFYLNKISDPDALSMHPDVVKAPVFGPSIIFGGQTANWTGNDNENAGLVALESRLNFETKAGKRVMATFEIHNIGTSSIYYDWKVCKIKHFNSKLKVEFFNKI